MKKPRILIVEDEAIVARDIRQQLIQLGYEPVANTAQGEEAVALAGGLRPDLVLMDIHLAGKMDGIAAAIAIREQFALPVVFLTAFADDEMLNCAKVADPFGYIIKPFEERELRTVIEVALFKHGAEMRLRQSHEVQDAILRSALDGYWLVDMEGRILEVNDACCQQHGYSRDEMLGKSVGDFEMEDSPEEIAAITAHIRQTGSARFEGRHRVKNGPPIDLEININYLPHSGGRCFAFMRDITGRKRVQEEREVTVRLLEVVNGKNNLHDLMQAATLLLRDWSGCASVGIRLKAGADFPYFEVRGFPAKFVQVESRLCQHAAAGHVVSDRAGHPALDCLCGNIIAGHFDPAQPFFTAHGTFWTNSITDLLAHTTEAERAARTRNCCREEGYESMALVPLRVGGTTLGLLQLNDRRRDQFSIERIKFFERLADSLAIAIAYRTANEETLRSERKFRSYIEHAPLGVFVINRAGRYLEVNPAGAQMMGYSEAEMLQMRVPDLIAPDTREEAARRFARLLEQGAISEEARLRRKDGTEFWASIIAAKLDDQRFIGFNQDITARKQAETALRESEDRLRTIINSEPECVKLVDADCTLLEMNPAGLRMLAADSLEQVRGGNVCELLAPEYRPSFCAGVAAVFRGETTKQAYEMVAFDGSRHWMEQHAVPLWDAEQPGRVKQMLAVTRDITERKRAEERLRNREAELAAIYDHAPVIMCLLDERQRIVHVNNAAATLGHKSGTLLGLGPGDLIGCANSLDDPRGCGFAAGCENCTLRQAIQDTLDNGQSHLGVESRLLVVNNQKQEDFHVIAHMAQLEIGDRKRVLLCLQDITGRKRAEDVLRRTEEQFRQAQKMEAVGQLAGGVAHDFNNILAAVLMYLGLLQDEPGMDRKIRASLKELEKEVHRGATLTRQLLAFSRHQAMEPRVLDVHEVVAGLLKMLRRLLGEHIKLALHGPPDLPRVEADAGMLEQVVINLCVNARDAMPQGGHLTLFLVAADVSAKTSANADARAGRFLRMSVSDTGSGMDEPTLRRIFEPFFTTKGVGQGTGLGLATVYGIVKQHHGWIDVESAVGRGSTFHVYLPVCDAPAAVVAEPAQPRLAGGQNELVLVVEDETMVRNVVAATLQRDGYRTIQATNGPEALKLWEKYGAEIALLFTDLLMPGGMTGRDLASQLRQKSPGLKVIIFTGYGKEMSAEPFATNSGITLLRKPADPVLLLGTVRRCLDGG